MHVRDRIVELRRVSARLLRPNPHNWRLHPKAQREALRGVLAEVGYADALIARRNEDGSLEIIDGHLRAETTPDMEVPVLVLDVTKEEAEKLLAALDPLAAMAGKDEEMLRDLLKGIETDNEALKTLFETLVPLDPKEGLTDPDDVPEPPAVAETTRGDLYLLGEHRLLCGDSSKDEDVDRLLDGARVHLVNTDPPYNVPVEPRSRSASDDGGAARRPRDRGIENNAISPEAFNALLTKWFGNIARVLVPGRSFYLWGGYSNVVTYPPAIAAAGLHFSQLVVWVKQHPTMTRKDFMGNHELAFYGWKEGGPHYFHPGIRNAEDVWFVKKVSPQVMVHLTEKPVELAVRAMEYSSRRGENVLDIFAGSGFTLVAAEQAERRAFLMEIDPLYCDVIVRRWCQFTGKKPEKERPLP